MAPTTEQKIKLHWTRKKIMDAKFHLAVFNNASECKKWRRKMSLLYKKLAEEVRSKQPNK